MDAEQINRLLAADSLQNSPDVLLGPTLDCASPAWGFPGPSPGLHAARNDAAFWARFPDEERKWQQLHRRRIPQNDRTLRRQYAAIAMCDRGLGAGNLARAAFAAQLP